jgi:enoyl-CoA hydratase/carnithine racemase
MKHSPTSPEDAVRWEVRENVARVYLSRPSRSNALDVAGWHALRDAFDAIDRHPDARVAVLQGEGAHFCAGIDLNVLARLRSQAKAEGDCDGRARESLARWILDLQGCVNAIERCRVPVIAAIHGVCFGGGVDIICACDLRVATRSARFCVKEVDLAVTADLGVLQRLPHLVGEGRARALALTAQEFDGAYAERIGLVTELFDAIDELRAGADHLAACLADKSPLAMRGTKQAALAARDEGVAAGLRQVAWWNAATLLSQDLNEAMTALHDKRPPQYPT